MSNEWMTDNEKSELEKTMEKLNSIRSFLNGIKTEKRKDCDVYEAFNEYKRFKEKVSNYNSDMAYISCLMAKEWLVNRFGSEIKKYKASEKPQAAPGLDIDIKMGGVPHYCRNKEYCSLQKRWELWCATDEINQSRFR